MISLESSLLCAEVIKRPSSTCKSPYVADIIIKGYPEMIEMAHAPSLGCNGMVECGKCVYVIKNNTNKICKYTIYVAIDDNDNIVGIHPKIAEKMAYNMLSSNLLFSLRYMIELKREVKIEDSRFDFVGIDKNGIKTIIEVKNVPLVCVCGDKKQSYFPDGYRKKKNEPVSPRAIKHLKTLTNLKREYKQNIRCIMLYIIQRDDSIIFVPSNNDPFYKDAFYEATSVGVEIYPCQFKWDILTSTCTFENLITYL